MICFRLHLYLPTTSKSPKTSHTNPSLSPAIRPLLRPAAFSVDGCVRFREKLLFISRDLGVDPSHALSLNPDLQAASISSLQRLPAFFASFGLLPYDFARILTLHPRLLTADLDADLLPVFRFLLGPAAIPFPDIRLSIYRCPRLLLSSVTGRLLPSLYFLRRLGFVGRHRITARTTVLLISDVERTLIPKFEFLQNLGFSYRETVMMILRSPVLLTFSIDENFRPKVDFLVGEMGREVRELKDFPQYFAFSLERRIKPRQQMLVEAGFESSSMPLAKMLKASDGEFREWHLEMRLKRLGESL